ncbi:hypothetical protein C1H76_8592 [Elsinoe australis]|uniref:Uncharacterized protein n=1 Tax=Elsinoe australis TaxID=40998 RepID=A0A4U7AUB0_9PEZI|nr:hypothetical protein C1H76_8592 [Elsinoe australis]
MENGQQQRSPLDQMQLMFSKALECTGQVFLAANQNGNRDRAAATAMRLKQIIPEANMRYHDALDELEAELMQARFILKRELATLREKEAAITNGTNAVQPVESKDVEMPDMPTLPDEPTVSIESQAPQAQMTNGTTTAPSPKPEASKPAPALIINTAGQDDSKDDAEPATGGMSAMDFDSLFNDPNSATASNSMVGTPTIAPDFADAPKPDTSAMQAAEQPNNDNNEDLSSLLPGLESYANADNDMIDLSTPEAKKPEGNQQVQTEGQGQRQNQNQGQDTSQQNQAQNSGQGQNQGQGQGQNQQNQDQSQNQNQTQNTVSNSGGSQAGEQRDTTFDDLMNFADFDMAGFGGGDDNFGDGSGATFDESFFNID